MDIEVKPIGNETWILTDLLGRQVGTIVKTSTGFLIEYDPASSLKGIDRGPHQTLNQAMTLVEKKTGGQCRRAAP